MLAKEKSIVLKKVRLYVQSMTKGDLKVKRVEPKSSQSAPNVAAMENAHVASKPVVVVGRTIKDSKAIEKKGLELLK